MWKEDKPLEFSNWITWLILRELEAYQAIYFNQKWRPLNDALNTLSNLLWSNLAVITIHIEGIKGICITFIFPSNWPLEGLMHSDALITIREIWLILKCSVMTFVAHPKCLRLVSWFQCIFDLKWWYISCRMGQYRSYMLTNHL